MFLQTNLEYIMHARRTNPRHAPLSAGLFIAQNLIG